MRCQSDLSKQAVVLRAPARQLFPTRDTVNASTKFPRYIRALTILTSELHKLAQPLYHHLSKHQQCQTSRASSRKPEPKLRASHNSITFRLNSLVKVNLRNSITLPQTPTHLQYHPTDPSPRLLHTGVPPSHPLHPYLRTSSTNSAPTAGETTSSKTTSQRTKTPSTHPTTNSSSVPYPQMVNSPLRD